MNSPIANLKMVVTGYACKVCGKWHRRPSKLFWQHFDQSNIEPWVIKPDQKPDQPKI